MRANPESDTALEALHGMREEMEADFNFEPRTRRVRDDFDLVIYRIQRLALGA